MLEIHSLSRSVNELLILAAIGKGAKHGYQIALEIEEGTDGYMTFNHGTLYPILHQLEKEGLIDGSWDEGRGRQRRKTYTLTASGRGRLDERYGDWVEFHQRLVHFVDAGEAVRSGVASRKRGASAS
jgi:DNA-binding PadR family transcriptional regulator